MSRAVTNSRSKGPGKARFERIFADGRRVNGTALRMAALPGTGLVGYATSRKIGGKPQRNRQRRRLRAAVQDCGGAFLPTMDYVLILGAACANAPYERLRKETLDLVLRANERWADNSESS